MRTRRRLSHLNAATGLVIAAAFVFAVVAVLVIVGAAVADRRRDVGVEAAKAGLQLMVLAVAGLGITGMVSWVARSADDRRRVNDAALEILRDVIASYNRMKASRRSLRAIGTVNRRPGERLSAEHASEFEREMRTLSEVQLAFERVGRELGVRLELLRDANKAPPLTGPQADVSTMEQYVYSVVKDWETHGAAVAASGYDNAAIAKLDSLHAFLCASKDDPKKRFRKSTSEPLRRLEDYFRNKLIVSLEPQDAHGAERRAAPG